MPDTELLWDSWGVPHIFAARDADAFRALGWAQVAAHGNLLLKLYAQARGRSAELWGEHYLESDRFVHRLGIPERALAWSEAQQPEMRGNLEAFVAGVNAHAAAHPEALEPEALAVLPVHLEDVFMHIQRVYAVYLTINGQRPSGEAPNDILLTTDLVPGMAAMGAGIGGSNAWAVGGSRTQSGQPILVANPHLQWADFFTFFEAHLNISGPEPLSLYGVAQVGWPVLRYGFNDHLGWAHTVNALKGWDAFALEPSGDGYLLDGTEHAFERRELRLKVRQADGTQREERLEVRRSRHGPVLHDPVLGAQGGKPVAARIVGFEVGDFSQLFSQYWRMARARTHAEFQAALELHHNPMFTVFYADNAGNIAHYFAGFVPRRRGGTWRDWAGTQPGTDSKLIWTELHDFSELPRVVNPPADWLQNANNPPWHTTLPAALNPDDYPAYLTSRLLTPREQRSIRLISNLESATPEEIMRRIASTRSETADRLLPPLLELLQSASHPLLQRAAKVLSGWDRCFDPDSVGADLFSRLLVAMRPADSSLSNLWAEPWTATDPLGTPRGLSDPAGAVNALLIAAQSLLRDTGTLERRWGSLARFRRGDFQREAHGHLDPFGVFRVSGYAPDGTGGYTASFGTTYIAITEFSQPVRARVLLGYGNSSQPHSPHHGDQLNLLADKSMREALLTRDQIEAHLERREVI